MSASSEGENQSAAVHRSVGKEARHRTHDRADDSKTEDTHRQTGRFLQTDNTFDIWIWRQWAAAKPREQARSEAQKFVDRQKSRREDSGQF